jgi:hypothetical protein
MTRRRNVVPSPFGEFSGFGKGADFGSELRAAAEEKENADTC